MKLLGDDIKSIKKIIHKKDKEYQEIKKVISVFLKEAFPSKDTSQYIKTFYVKKRILYLETTRKIFAQEIYFHLPTLLKKMPKFIERVRVK